MIHTNEEFPLWAQRFNTVFRNVQVIYDGIQSAEINEDGHLVVTYSDGHFEDIGLVVGRDGRDGEDGEPGAPGRDGVDGVSPTVEIQESTETEYTLKITDAEHEFVTPNLMGKKGDPGETGPKGEPGGMTAKLYVDAPIEATVVCKKGDKTIEAIPEGTLLTFFPDEFGTWSVIATYEGDTKQEDIYVDMVKEYFSVITFNRVYGVEWDKTGQTMLGRTDDAKFYPDPIPYYSGMDVAPYSEFDRRYPWSDIRVVDDPAGKLVEIPKFWYKITSTDSRLKIQIASEARDGFSISPAHADRGDGLGERDVIYVGRYHCDDTYKSESGKSPVRNLTRASARSGIRANGTEYSQIDFATLWTIRLLYIVEYADWHSQGVIGYGCGNGSSPAVSGYTDSMPYHTGTTATSKLAYGGTQYRYMEGLWDGVYDWSDGVYCTSAGDVYVITDPDEFSDTTGGTLLGSRVNSGGYISDYYQPDSEGCDWALLPNEFDGTAATYITDFQEFTGTGTVFYHGGSYVRSQKYGMFFQGEDVSQNFSGEQFGCRLQKLPS